MTRDVDELAEAFAVISDRDLRRAIVQAVRDAAFVDSLVGAPDSYLRTEGGGSAKVKKDAKEPAGLLFVKDVRRITRSFRTVSNSADRIAVDLDHRREVHDRGKAAAGESPAQRAKRFRKESRIAAHLTNKVAEATEGKEASR